MAFTKYLSEEMINALNEEYRREAGWWRVLADHPDTLIAIRNKYLNVYRNGCNIAKVAQRTDGELTISVHYKFLLKKKIPHPFVSCTNGSPEIADPNELLISSLSDIGDIIYWTDTLGGLEKTGVHRVIRANANVIDTEIALSGAAKDESDVPATLDEGKSSRIDFCAVRKEGSQLWLRFFEAKDYSYKAALAAAAEHLPKAVEQLLRYWKTLKGQKTQTQIGDAYKRLIELAHRIHGRNVLGKNIPLSGLEKLQVDPVPRLVVFGYDDDQKKRKGGKFQTHMEKLRSALKRETGVDCLLLTGSAKHFTAGISK